MKTPAGSDSQSLVQKISVFLVPFIGLVVAPHADAEPPADHIRDEHGVMHAMDLNLPYSSHCTDCHAKDLLGGRGPSCYQCHGTYWNEYDETFLAPPEDHTSVKGEGTKHKPGFGMPTESGCTLCHGPNLNDGFATSCFACHGELWGGNGPPDDHTEVKGDGTLHKPGFGDPLTSGCTQCHGPNLDDGFASSCYTCHGPLWAGGGPPADHTDLLLFALHKPGYGDPIANECTQCHGPNLNDGFAIACSDCHGPVWQGTDGHHMPGRNEPWTWCTTCHGEDLLGDSFGEVNSPACVSCHSDFSPPDPPAPGHHFPVRDAPLTNCAVCHGDDLDGISDPPMPTPSCFACHDGLWPEENLPPDVDAGGPYQGITDQPVTFDASSTNDPDGDILTFSWDFGDGSPPSSPSEDPTAVHSYGQAGSYTARLTVTDQINDPVMVEVPVEISNEGTLPTCGDQWDVTTTASPPETFTITFETHAGSLVAVKKDGIHPASFALGIELPGVIFWMDIWLDMSGSALWGVGDTFFGNIDREAQTMAGIVYEETGGIATFTATTSESPTNE